MLAKVHAPAKTVPVVPGHYLYRKSPAHNWEVVDVFPWGDPKKWKDGDSLYVQTSPIDHDPVESVNGEWSELPNPSRRSTAKERVMEALSEEFCAELLKACEWDHQTPERYLRAVMAKCPFPFGC